MALLSFCLTVCWPVNNNYLYFQVKIPLVEIIKRSVILSADCAMTNKSLRIVVLDVYNKSIIKSMPRCFSKTSLNILISSNTQRWIPM